MVGTRITSFAINELSPMQYQGMTVIEYCLEIQDVLRKKFGNAYLLFFAEPVRDSIHNVIEWYSPIHGNIQRMMDCSVELQQKIHIQLAQIATKIQLYANELKHSSDSHDIVYGNMLESLLCYTDEEAIFVVGEQPVVTCWGCEQTQTENENNKYAYLTALASVAPIEPQTPDLSNASNNDSNKKEDSENHGCLFLQDIAGDGCTAWVQDGCSFSGCLPTSCLEIVALSLAVLFICICI